jgi:chromosome segregation ATPase
LSRRTKPPKQRYVLPRLTPADRQYKSDLAKLKSTNEALQNTNDEIKGKEAKILAKVSDIRSKLALAEAENGRLKKELASRPLPLAGPSVDDRLTWRKEKAALESEIKLLKKDAEARSKRVEEAAKEGASLKELKGENERLKYGWGVMTDQYAELWEAHESGKTAWQREKQSLESEQRELNNRVNVAELGHAAKTEECEDQRQHIRQIRAERDILNDMFDAIRMNQLERVSLQIPCSDDISPLSPFLESSDIYNLLDLTTTHISLIQEYGSDLEPHILSLTASIMDLGQSLRETTHTLTTLQTSHARLEAEYADVRLEHAPCAVTISQLRYEADQAQQFTRVREEELDEVRAEMRKVEERFDRQAELAAKANEGEARSKFALESLEEEIVQ